jgi:hypothetical protein
LVADVVKALVPDPWQRVVVPAGAVGVPTVGITVTVVVAVVDVPHEFVAVTETTADPLNPAAHVTVPVVDVPLMLLPVPVTDHA